MRIVIPMAGHSERFKQAGYSVPKPFMLVDDRPMIHWVCDLFEPTDEFVFVVQQGHAEVVDYRSILQSAAPKQSIVEIEPNRLGPVYTALAADAVVGDGEPVIISYADYYQHWNYQQFLWRVAPYDGGLTVFKGFHPASFGDTYYAYMRCNDQGDMLEIREKRSFTENRAEEPASSGVYYFKSWSLYRDLAQKLLSANQSVANEYYVSLLYNLMVEGSLNVTTFEVDKFICWGTPEDVEHYLFWSEFFQNDANRLMARQA